MQPTLKHPLFNFIRCLFVLLYMLSGSAWAQFAQQGPKLVGTGAVGAANQGYSVSLSADGNTAIVGGYDDDSSRGAAWVYTRSGDVWIQQGPKLVGTGTPGPASQGFSVSLSADGNTAIVGGATDHYFTGAVWIYTRSGGVWTQQGPKLVGNEVDGAAFQGWSVSLSGDGNTAIVGGFNNHTLFGAAWVYTRSGGVWTNQVLGLVGAGATGAANLGISVSLSGDGNTAIVGWDSDNSQTGAAWVYTRNGGVWTQQGAKLVGTGAMGAANQGRSVSLSADGNIAIVGGGGDNSGTGAAWVYTRSGGVWTQQGAKLVGTGVVGASGQGRSVSLSADGNIAIVGGGGDNSGTGAAWVYTRSGGVWTQQGAKLVGTNTVGGATQGNSISLSGDGNTAIVGGYHDNMGTGAAWVFTNLPDTTPPVVTSSVLGGTYNLAQTVTLSTNETANIYYTTNGSTPTTSSTLYTGPIAINASMTLKYFAVDAAGNPSVVQTQLYTISTQRAFVASYGLDSNTVFTCNVAHPCRTFATAVTVVDPNGEVIAVDSAGYGGTVTLTRSISLIAAPGVYAGMSVFPGTTGVTIATPGVNVVLRGLTINGQGGDYGISMTAGTNLSIENCVISNFSGVAQHGVSVNTAATVRMVKTFVRDNTNGIVFRGGATADISGSKFLGNGYGIAVLNTTGTTTTAAVSDTVVTGGDYGVFANSSAAGKAWIDLIHSTITDANVAGIAASATAGTASIAFGYSKVSENAIGFWQDTGGTLWSLGNNIVRNNGTNTGVLTPFVPQ